MTYPLRVCFDGAIYHVALRGNNREAVFADNEDRLKYLSLLARSKKQHQFLLFAYVLMSNHVHLLIQPSIKATISTIMQGLTIAYTRHFNKRHERVGHIFQGRFFSRLVQTDADLLCVSRYIHLNPVKAEMVRHLLDYHWSSYPAYAYGESRNRLNLADCGLILELSGKVNGSEKKAYREFVELDAQTPANFLQLQDLISI